MFKTKILQKVMIATAVTASAVFIIYNIFKQQKDKQRTLEEQEKIEQEEEEEEEGKTYEVIVKGLSFQAYENDVKELFEPFGNVVNVKLLTRDDGKSKGLAFIRFSKKASFDKALELNGTDHFGRNITVEEAQGKSNDGSNFNNNQGGFNKFQPQTNADIQTSTLFIGGLSFNSTQESISAHFSSIGEVVRARVVIDRLTRKPRGFGYVEFNDVETAKRAYNSLNGSNLDGRQIRLQGASQRTGKANSGGNRGNQGARNEGNQTVDSNMEGMNAKRGVMENFQGTKMMTFLLQ